MKIKKVIASFLALCMLIGPITAYAAKEPSIVSFANACEQDGYGVGFFNGVGNSISDAQISTALVAKAVRASNAAAFDADIRVSLFYNETNKLLKIIPLHDLMEVFVQRAEAAEPDLGKRLELFWLAMSERTEEGFLNKLKQRLGDGAMAAFDLLDGIYEDVIVEATGLLASAFGGNLEAYQMYANHQAKIQSWALEGRRMLMVAHSQGNLFVNQAYQAAVGLTGYSSDSIGVVHIAPASQELSGPYTLADKDVVIHMLRLQGLSSVPASNVTIPLSFSDGHGLEGVYLNKDLDTYNHVLNNIKDVFGSLQKPSLASDRGIFTATLVWDREGDIDLHTFEPDNTQVYYGMKYGKSGKLDYDDKYARGPEHYNAKCDSTSLQRGTYRFGVNNYAGQVGTKATLIVTTSDNKNVLTKSVVVGEAIGSMGDSNPITIGTIEVATVGAERDGENFVEIKGN